MLEHRAGTRPLRRGRENVEAHGADARVRSPTRGFGHRPEEADTASVGEQALSVSCAPSSSFLVSQCGGRDSRSSLCGGWNTGLCLANPGHRAVLSRLSLLARSARALLLSLFCHQPSSLVGRLEQSSHPEHLKQRPHRPKPGARRRPRQPPARVTVSLPSCHAVTSVVAQKGSHSHALRLGAT